MQAEKQKKKVESTTIIISILRNAEKSSSQWTRINFFLFMILI